MSYSLENQILHVSVGEEALDVDVGFIFHSSDRKEVGLVVLSHVDTRCNLVKQSPSEEELYAMIQAVLRE